jgi:hypothetical protein
VLRSCCLATAVSAGFKILALSKYATVLCTLCGKYFIYVVNDVLETVSVLFIRNVSDILQTREKNCFITVIRSFPFWCLFKLLYLKVKLHINISKNTIIICYEQLFSCISRFVALRKLSTTSCCSLSCPVSAFVCILRWQGFASCIKLTFVSGQFICFNLMHVKLPHKEVYVTLLFRSNIFRSKIYSNGYK